MSYMRIREIDRQLSRFDKVQADWRRLLEEHEGDLEALRKDHTRAARTTAKEQLAWRRACLQVTDGMSVQERRLLSVADVIALAGQPHPAHIQALHGVYEQAQEAQAEAQKVFDEKARAVAQINARITTNEAAVVVLSEERARLASMLAAEEAEAERERLAITERRAGSSVVARPRTAIGAVA